MDMPSFLRRPMFNQQRRQPLNKPPVNPGQKPAPPK